MPLEIPEGVRVPGVVGCALLLDEVLPPLYPEERTAIARAVPRRVVEFTAGRAAARLALAALGVPPCPLPAGADRVPRFPSEVTGSLSHSRSLAFAAVAWRSEVAGLGVDVEGDDPLAPELIPIITTTAERAAAPADRATWAKLMFSAKEAMFKCWYTSGGGRLADFEEFELALSSDGAISVTRMPDPQLPLRGRWARAEGAFWVVATTERAAPRR